MSDRAYWLCLFNQTTWQEFQESGANVMGFPETRQSTVRRIKQGDYLLAYMTHLSRWFAVLEVDSDPYEDLTQIWKQALFPCRVKVKVLTHVAPDLGVPALALSKNLKMFDSFDNPNWGLLFRLAPKELHTDDGVLLTQAIQEIAA